MLRIMSKMHSYILRMPFQCLCFLFVSLSISGSPRHSVKHKLRIFSSVNLFRIDSST